MVSPIENMIHINQNMPLAAHNQVDFQSKVEFYNLVAAHIVNNKETTVEEASNISENIAINPDKEHQKEESEQATKEKEEEEKILLKLTKKKKQKPKKSSHLLDIRV